MQTDFMHFNVAADRGWGTLGAEKTVLVALLLTVSARKSCSFVMFHEMVALVVIWIQLLDVSFVTQHLLEPNQTSTCRICVHS